MTVTRPSHLQRHTCDQTLKTLILCFVSRGYHTTHVCLWEAGVPGQTFARERLITRSSCGSPCPAHLSLHLSRAGVGSHPSLLSCCSVIGSIAMRHACRWLSCLCVCACEGNLLAIIIFFLLSIFISCLNLNYLYICHCSYHCYHIYLSFIIFLWIFHYFTRLCSKHSHYCYHHCLLVSFIIAITIIFAH